MRARLLLSAAVAMAVGSTAFADLTVNQNLGSLTPGAYPFSGTTVGQDNGADTYAPIGNEQAIWDQDYVYQFTTSQTMQASLTSNDPNGATVDNDFFLLNSLGTTVNSFGRTAANTLNAGLVEVSGSLGLIPAGTYYLSIDAWRGVPGAAGDPGAGRAGPFNGTLSLSAFVPPPPPAGTVDAVLGGSVSGSIGAGEIDWYRFDYSGGGFSLDTIGSTFTPDNDTELGLFDANGQLVASDDDGAGVGLLSQIDSPTGLPNGQYYLAIGGFNTTFANGFSATTSAGSDSGAYVINGLSVVPEPTGIAALGLAATMVIRRRRSN